MPVSCLSLYSQCCLSKCHLPSCRSKQLLFLTSYQQGQLILYTVQDWLASKTKLTYDGPVLYAAAAWPCP